MSEEIVRKLLSNKKKIIFESVDVSDTEDKDEEILLDQENNLEDEPTEETVEVEDSLPEEEKVEYEPCICGSTDVSMENGQAICNECGRALSLKELGEPVVPKEANEEKSDEEIDEADEDRDSQLKTVLSVWNQGKYQRAMELCKRYGISEREFAFALVKSFRESEEGVDLDADDLDEALDMPAGTLYIDRDGKESLRLLVNGVEYRYRSRVLDINELLRKFMGIYKHSVGQALAWLKKNSYVYYNGRTHQFAENLEYKDNLKESANDVGYIVVYTYDGDELSDYEGSVLVAAQSDREAIKKAEDRIKKKKLDARHFYVREKVPSISAWKKQYPKSNTEILESKKVNEGRYTGTTTVKNTAKKVLDNHGLNNSTGKYDKFVNRMWNLYKETLLDVDKLEEVMEREFKKMYPDLREDADMELISPNSEDNLGNNIIRAIQTPVTTAKKPNLDAAIIEAMSSRKSKN